MKKIINTLIILTAIILYVYLMFFSNITLGTGKKELENVLLLAAPCFLLLFTSFEIKEIKPRNNILKIYLLLYLIIVIGFTCSNFRDSTLINNGIMERDINLIPFNSIINLLNHPLGLKFGLYNILGNFLMLVPLSVLLPLIDESFKRIWKFISMTFMISLFIECFQLITNLGSFDIDDILLNSFGAVFLYLIIFKTNIYKWFYNIFYKFNIPLKIANCFYYLILLFIVIIDVFYINLIYVKYKESKIDFSNMICEISEKTYIGTFGNYNYYSKCKLSGYIIRGVQTLSPNELLESIGENIEKYAAELKLIKEDAITNVEVSLSKGVFKIIKNEDFQQIYLVDIDRISYLKNGIECIIDKEIPLDETCHANLTDVYKMDLNKGYIIYKGTYYNKLSCITGKYIDSKSIDYIVPLDYKLNADSCEILRKL